MTQFMIVVAMLVLVIGAAPRHAAAQDNTLGGALLGGAAGAAIGGIATGKAGGAVVGGVIGAATGAMIGSQLEPRPRYGKYYWYKGRCWRLARDGNYYRTRSRYCNY